MYQLHCVLAGTLELCENYDTIEEAVRESVTYWLEGADNPRPQVLTDEHGVPAVTFVPVGTCGDQLLVVYNVMGLVKRYANLVYHNDPETGYMDRTTVTCDGVEETFWHADERPRADSIRNPK